ncbi:hypothetical protein ACA910_007771 [Epithemia clementina (nom. ined.)]
MAVVRNKIAFGDLSNLRHGARICRSDSSDCWKRLPQGAEEIIKTIAAERILLDMINRFDRPDLVNHKAVERLLNQYPVLSTRIYAVNIGKQEIRELSLLAVLCLLEPPVELIEYVYRLHPEAISMPEPIQESLPVHYACRRSSLEVVTFLAEQYPKGLRAKRKDGTLPMHMACRFNPRTELIAFLVEKYPEACATCSSDGWFPLHCATQSRALLVAVIKLHETHPQSAGYVNDKGWTPLHIACERRGNAEVVGYLAFAAANTMQVRDLYWHTPLFIAVKHQTVHVIRLMLEWARTRPSMDIEGRTLLHVACVHNSAEVVDLVAKFYPAMVMSRTADYDRFTPLHEVCRYNPSLPIIQTLISHDRRLLLLRDREGKTALHHARRRGAPAEVIDFLIECGM